MLAVGEWANGAALTALQAPPAWDALHSDAPWHVALSNPLVARQVVRYCLPTCRPPLPCCHVFAAAAETSQDTVIHHFWWFQPFGGFSEGMWLSGCQPPLLAGYSSCLVVSIDRQRNWQNAHSAGRVSIINRRCSTVPAAFAGSVAYEAPF